jgi:hypothetical protein
VPDPRVRYTEDLLPGVMPAGPSVRNRSDTKIDQLLSSGEMNGQFVDLTVTGALVHTGPVIAEYGDGGATQGGPFVQTYATADATLSAYTPDTESVAYTGLASGLGGTPYASVTDVNALRVAVENLRSFTEDAVGLLNAVVDYFQTRGTFG